MRIPRLRRDAFIAARRDKGGGSPRRESRSWIGRIGMIGFLFFLVKGLLWLLIPSLIAIGLL